MEDFFAVGVRARVPAIRANRSSVAIVSLLSYFCYRFPRGPRWDGVGTIPGRIAAKMWRFGVSDPRNPLPSLKLSKNCSLSLANRAVLIRRTC